MKRLALLLFLLVPCSLLHAAKPNIIMILADDLGRMDTAAFGAKHFETPVLDQLAAEGIRLNDFHANSPNCAPSRAALYTGQYAPRTGVFNVAESEKGSEQHRTVFCPKNLKDLPLCKPTFAEPLQRAGYRTGLFGKWHVGEEGDYHPTKRGFDESIVLENPTANGHYHFVTAPPVEHPEGQYLADFLTDRAVRFIEKSASDPRPFYLQVNHFLVHAPYEAPPDIVVRFREKLKGVPDVDPVYAAMIWYLDQCVGRILDAVEKHGLTSNTVVLFTSDNGGVGGYSALGIKGAHEVTSNLPFKGGKTQLYEGGTRLPFIVKWPGVIPTGSVSDAPAMMVDLFPTLMEIAAASAPDRHRDATDELTAMLRPPAEFRLDGTSLVAHLHSGGREPLPVRDMFWFFPAYCGAPDGPTRIEWRSTPQASVRDAEGFKFNEHYHDGYEELYDLRRDPSEQTNLAAQLPDKARELRDKLHRWMHDTNAPVPMLKSRLPRAEELDADKQAVVTGLSGLPLTPEHARLLYYHGELGIFITAAALPSLGIKPGWILLDIAGQRTRSAADFQQALASVKRGDAVKFTYSNGIKVKTGKLASDTENPPAPSSKKKKAKTTTTED